MMDQGNNTGSPAAEKVTPASENSELTRIALLTDYLRELAIVIARGDANKLHAIKAWRAATGATLKDSKDYIEALSTSAIQQKEVSRLQRVEDRIFHLEGRVSSLERRTPPCND